MKQLIRVKRSGADYSIFLITFAGLPPTTTLSGTSFVTTAPAATTAFLPMVTPGQMMAPMHIDAFSSIVEKVVSIVQVVIDCRNLNLGANQNIVFYHHFPRREYSRSFVDSHILPDSHPASAITIERGNDSDAIVYLTLEQFFQQTLVIWIGRFLGRDLQT